jgi:hypothetical protein
MSSHDHDSSSTDRPAPGSQPAHLGNATQRAVVVMRQTQATNQTGRSDSPGRGMDASSADPFRVQRSPAASHRPGARGQKGGTRPRSRIAARGIIEATEHPAPRPAINPERPLPLSQLPHLLRHTALEYGLARVQNHGTIYNHRIVRALHWQHADRLDAELTSRAIILRSSPSGRVGVQQGLHMLIPAAARRFHGIMTGDHPLLAAAPDYSLLLIHTMRAVDELLIALDAGLLAASPAAAADASAIVSPVAARGKP